MPGGDEWRVRGPTSPLTLAIAAQEGMGGEYHGIGAFKGYNEFVLAADSWLEHLPRRCAREAGSIRTWRALLRVRTTPPARA